MRSKYGDLEKYLGKKYAHDLNQSGLGPFMFEECSEILDASHQVMEMYAKVKLALGNQRFLPG